MFFCCSTFPLCAYTASLVVASAYAASKKRKTPQPSRKTKKTASPHSDGYYWGWVSKKMKNGKQGHYHYCKGTDLHGNRCKGSKFRYVEYDYDEVIKNHSPGCHHDPSAARQATNKKEVNEMLKSGASAGAAMDKQALNLAESKESGFEYNLVPQRIISRMVAKVREQNMEGRRSGSLSDSDLVQLLAISSLIGLQQWWTQLPEVS